MNINISTHFRRGITLLALVAVAAVHVKAATHTLKAITCGTWDSAGNHTVGEYFTGFSRERPNNTVSYFIFDLSSIKGKNVTNCNLTITGTKDFAFTAIWANHTPTHQFKIGCTPMNPGKLTVAQITTGNHNSSIWKDVHSEQNLGYGWLPDGLHPGFHLDAFHYNNQRLQAAVNAGGLFALFGVERFDNQNTGEQYIWGQSKFAGTQLELNVTTSN